MIFGRKLSYTVIRDLCAASGFSLVMRKHYTICELIESEPIYIWLYTLSGLEKRRFGGNPALVGLGVSIYYNGLLVSVSIP